MRDVKGASFVNNKPAVVARRMEDTGIIENQRAYTLLHNIGLGAAKNITVSWQYNKKEVKDLFDSVYDCFDIKETETEHLDFIPADTKMNILAPFYYLTCCGKQLNEELNDVIEPINEKPKPNLKLRLQYQDIYNNWVKKVFNVAINSYTDFVEFKFNSE
jgi:hypothetical protein